MGRGLIAKHAAGRRAPHNLAIGGLLVLTALAVAGPSGFLAWSENLRLLDKRTAHLAAVNAEKASLANRVALMDPDAVDPDLAVELLRSELNVVHPNEIVVELND